MIDLTKCNCLIEMANLIQQNPGDWEFGLGEDAVDIVKIGFPIFYDTTRYYFNEYWDDILNDDEEERIRDALYCIFNSCPDCDIEAISAGTIELVLATVLIMDRVEEFL